MLSLNIHVHVSYSHMKQSKVIIKSEYGLKAENLPMRPITILANNPSPDICFAEISF